MRQAARRLVFDFDDAVFLRDSYSPKGLHSSRRRRRFAAMARAADAVVAGNDFLASEAARWVGQERVHQPVAGGMPIANPHAELRYVLRYGDAQHRSAHRLARMVDRPSRPR